MPEVTDDFDVLVPVFVGALALIFFPAVAWARTAGGVPASGCGTEFSRVYYSAVFEWNNASTGKPVPFKLVIGMPNTGNEGAPVARIWSGNTCQAQCQLGNFQRESSYAPVSLDLECKSSQLSPMTSFATVLWKTPNRPPILRFGTWLQGYEQATLQVHVDEYSLPSPSRMSKRLAYRAPSLE